MGHLELGMALGLGELLCGDDRLRRALGESIGAHRSVASRVGLLDGSQDRLELSALVIVQLGEHDARRDEEIALLPTIRASGGRVP